MDDQHLKPIFPERGPEMRNYASFSDIMESIKSPWPSSNNTSELIEPENHGGAYSKLSRKFDLPETHALNAKLGFFSSNVGSPAVSVSEALKLAAMARPAPQNLTLVADNNDPCYHQSIAAEILGNASAMNDYDTDFSFDDASSFQYKANNRHLISQQQNNNENSSAMWRLQYGSNSRTMSAVPASSSTYYNNYERQQQNEQHPSESRQGCQVSQNYVYPDFYRAQTGMLCNPQSWNPRNGSFGVSQRQPNQSQFWLENY